MDVDDRGTGPPGEQRGVGAREEERAEEVGLHVPADVVVGVCEDSRGGRRGTGVVDEHRDIRRGLDRVTDGLGIRHVERERDDALVIPAAWHAGTGIHLGGSAGERLMDELRADASVRSGDEDDGSVE